MIGKRRHKSIAHSHRFCKFCLRRNGYVIEDEFHLFFVCPIYEEIRNIYFTPEWVRNIVKPHTFYALMSGDGTSLILSIAKFLVSAFNHRKELMQDFADG